MKIPLTKHVSIVECSNPTSSCLKFYTGLFGLLPLSWFRSSCVAPGGSDALCFKLYLSYLGCDSFAMPAVHRALEMCLLFVFCQTYGSTGWLFPILSHRLCKHDLDKHNAHWYPKNTAQRVGRIGMWESGQHVTACLRMCNVYSAQSSWFLLCDLLELFA